MSARTIWRWSGLLVVVTMIVSMAAATVSASPAPARLETTSAQQPSPVEAGKPTPQKQPSPTPTGPIGLTVSRPLRFSVSPPLRDLARIAPPPKAGPPRQIPLLPLPKALKGGGRGQPGAPLQNRHSLPQMPSPIVNFEGNSNADNQTVVGFPVQPPDTQGDVGPNHYIQWVNLVFSIYDKNGNRLLGPLPGNTLWASNPSFEACDTSNDGDPITLYDPLADRWLMSQFALPNFPYGPFYQCIAVSQTPDPLGSWYLYEYRMPVNKMNDYPKFGVWPDAYYMAVNQFNAGSLSWGGAGVAAFERSRMLVGDPAARMIYIDVGAVNLGYGGMLPADLDGPPFGNPPPPGAPGLFVEWDDSTWLGDPTDTLRIWEFRVNWTNLANSTFGANSNYDPNYMVPTTDVDPNMCNFSRNCIPQPGTANSLDAISDRLMYRLQYRNFGSYQTLASNHTVDADGTDHAGIHWFILRNSGAGWTMDQEGVYAPDDHHRWMGSFALDHMGNAALGYSISSSSVHPGIRYSGRLADDPSGTLPRGEAVLIDGTGSQTGWSSRWGDYSMMSVDPADDCTFWYTQEYYAANGSTWQTRIGSFRFPNCSVGPTGTLTGRVYDSGTSAGIAGASVQAASSPTRTFSAVSDSNGYYTLTLPVGTYTVTASAYGYQFNSISGVEVLSGTITMQDIPLTPAPSYVVSGTVRDANTNWPLYARIRIDGYPGGPIWTDPVSGHYSVTLAGGLTYIFHISAWVNGYLSEDRSVGPLTGDRTEDFALQVDAEACNAPGYHLNWYYFQDFEADDGGFTTSGRNSSWAWGAPTSGPGAAHSGSNVWATNLAGNYNNNENSYLESPDIDLSGLAGQTILLSWWQWLRTERNFDFASVEVSNDGGSTWTTVWGPTSGGTAQWEKIAVLLDPSYAVSNFRVRFHLVADSWITYPGWYVDDVAIDLGAPPCVPDPGGLVVGNVYDANTGAGLTGARVANDSGYQTVALATPDDPNVGDAFYTLFSPAGSRVFTATVTRAGYQPDVKTVTVVQSDTVRQDFYLPAGFLDITPNSIAVTLTLGMSRTIPLTLTNSGGADAAFEIVEKDRGFQSMVRRTGPFAEPRALVPPEQQNARTTEGLDLPPAPSGTILAAGDVIRSWSPANNPSPWGIAYTSDDTVWVGEGWGANHIDEYTLDGTFTGRSWPYSWRPTFGPADSAFNWNTGMVWTLDVGGDNCLHEMDPAGGYTGNTICGPWSVSQRGVAYDPATDTWYVGGWNEGIIYHIDSNGNLLDSAFVRLAIAGLAYNPDTHHLFVMVNGNPNPVYVLDASQPGYPQIGQFYVSQGFGAYAGAGLEIDCEGNLWAVDQGTNTVYQFESGETASLCAMDVPWLSEVPVSGTVTAGGSVLVNVTLDTGVIAQTGKYYATLRFKNNTPYGVLEVPVTMTVAVYGLALSPASASQSGRPGEVVTYTLTVTNTGNITDTFSVAVSGNTWTTRAPTTVGPLAAGTSATLQITVTIPANARAGASDTATVTLTSQGDATQSAQSSLTTTALAVYGLALSPASASQSGRPGEVVTYTLTVTNTGNITDTFSVAVSGNTWTTRAPTTVGPLAAGTSATLQITVTIPANARAGASDTATVTLTSQGDATQSAQSSLTTTALAVYGLALSPASASQSGRPGEVVTYTLTVTNTGNITDTFSVAVSGNTWTTRAPTTVGPLAAGTSATLQITVTIPTGVTGVDSDTATVTVTSQGDNSKTAQAALTTRRVLYRLFLPVVMRNYGP
jgi:uncharacterized membrane protein